MVHLLEFHGRLGRREGMPIEPGRYDLRFALHPSRDTDATLWEDTLSGVRVGSGGAFDVMLGENDSLDHALFDGGPRWVSVRLPDGDELCERVPVLGATVRLGRLVDALATRVGTMESRRGGEDGEEVRRRLAILRRRVRAMERGDGVVGSLSIGLASVEQRLAQLDAEDGRLMRLEDEIEDIVGPDGDIIDLLERVEKLEGRGPVPDRVVPSALTRPDVKLTPYVVERLETLERRLHEIEGRPPPPPAPTAESLHVVRRAGDTMTGGLIINRGGLDVLSGGIKCRGAEVNSLEASFFVKAPKLIGDGLELRGDFTVDNTHRFVQVRHVEGRAGSGRKDGPLHLNARSGGEVVIGRSTEGSDGLVVHGHARADSLGTPGEGVAVAFTAASEVHPGDVVVANDFGNAAHAKEAYDPRVIGVVVASAGLLTGAGPGGKVQVAVAGVVRCRVDAAVPVRVGDLLVTSEVRGHARKAEDRERAFGSVVGKALAALGEGRGEILVLVMPR